MIYVQVGNKIVKEIIFFFLWRNEKHCLNCSDKILLELIQLVLALQFICHWNSTYFEKFLSAKFIGQLMRVPHNDGCVAGVANSFFLPHARCCFLATQKLLKIPLVPKLLLLLPYLFCSRLIIPCPCGGPIPYLPPPPPSPPTKIKD